MKADGDHWLKRSFECKNQGDCQLHDPVVLRRAHKSSKASCCGERSGVQVGAGTHRGHVGETLVHSHMPSSCHFHQLQTGNSRRYINSIKAPTGTTLDGKLGP